MKKMLVTFSSLIIVGSISAQLPLPTTNLMPVVSIAPTTVSVATVRQAPVTNITSMAVTGFRPLSVQYLLPTGNWQMTALALTTSNRPVRVVSATVSAADVLAATGLVESNLAGRALTDAVQSAAIQKLLAGLQTGK